MYALMFEVAAAREWKVWPQFPLSTTDSTKYVDFVFYGKSKKHPIEDRVAAVEMSYIRGKDNKKDKISVDEAKLSAFESEHFFKGKFGKIKRYVIIAGKENDMEKYCKRHLKKAVVFFGNGKRSRGSGWIYFSPIKFQKDGVSTRWCVLVLPVKGS
jgi:hypothetical protein